MEGAEKIKDEQIKNLEKKLNELTLQNKRNNNNDNIINNNNSNDLQKLFAKLEEKEKEIDRLNDQLIGSIKYDDVKIGDKLIAVNLVSGDQKINFPIVCKPSTKFSDVEWILYKKYPEYAENDGEDNLFLANGIKMKRFKTMGENGFNGYCITLMKNNNFK